MAREVMKNQPLLTEPELRARLGELYAAIDQFNRRWYFESHETLEELWMVTPFPERDFMQGIIQLAAAFVHFARGEYPGIFKLLDQSLEKLGRFTPVQFGVDVTRLVADAGRARAEIEALGIERFRVWDERNAPVISYEADV
jgi:predicted metal-dependent hydrolase